MLLTTFGRGSAASASFRLAYINWHRLLPAFSSDPSQSAKGFARKASGDTGGQDDLPRSKQSKGWREWADKVLDKGELPGESDQVASTAQEPDAGARLDAERQQAASLADPAGIEAAQAGAKASLPDAPDIEAGASVLEDGSRPEAASSAAAAAVAEMLDEPQQQPSPRMPEPPEAAPRTCAELPEAAQAAVQDLADAALMQKSSPEAALRKMMDRQPQQAASKQILPKKPSAPARQPPAQPQQPALAAGPGRRAVFPEPSERPNEMMGFAKLGDQTAEDIRPATSFGFTGRIHPTRNFFPGQVYTPQDLIRAPADAQAASPPPRNWAPKPQLKRMPAHEVLENATFTNYEMLDNFVTDAGKLHPRRRTALQAKTHRYLNRQIKIARIMALLPPTRRLSDRWEELEQSQYEVQQ